MVRKPKKKDSEIRKDAELSIRVVNPEDWETIVRLFGEKGACGGCWCMSWRVPKHGKAWEEAKGEKNRLALQTLVLADQLHAVLAFMGDEPVGWCSFGPRETFPRLLNIRALQRAWTKETWSIVCFYILPAWRRKGISTKLLQAATARAFALGAVEVEGYPVVPADPTVAVPGAFAWTGVPALFQESGYHEDPRPGVSRPIYIASRPDSKTE